MKTYLRQHVIGPAPEEVPISDAQFEAARSARVVLSSAFALEESYDLLIGNYIEVEQELLTAAAANAARSTKSYENFFELRSTVNRRVVNLLTACRLYLDQTPQHLATCAQDPTTARTDFRQRTSVHYDASFAYRFLEALRNHVQHCGLAVHRLSINNKWNGAGETRELELSIQPFAEKHYLAEDAKFKLKVLNETPAQVVLTKVIREYLQCLGDVHNLVRGHVAVNVEAARLTIQQHLSAYGAANNGQTIGLAAFRDGPTGQQETVSLSLGWDDVRMKLVARNATLTALGRHVVTGRAT